MKNIENKTISFFSLLNVYMVYQIYFWFSFLVLFLSWLFVFNHHYNLSYIEELQTEQQAIVIRRGLTLRVRHRPRSE